ncbi:MAG: hypothetical protein CMI53_00810 [Parcubacteria group bacterium]|nr:hypothetical protein [Parcubacteria group bacterium]|tara:strand:- start:7355 stop:8194 length:840 start_codon:yes stop_codon:yes gene_type:complete
MTPETPSYIPPEANQPKEAKSNVTNEALRNKVDKVLGLFCKEFTVDGKENLTQIQEVEPDSKFIVASSHISNLDAPAAIKALGDKLDIQITTESVLRGATPQEVLFRLAGKDQFTSLQYKKTKKGKHGVFNPDDFKLLSEQIEDGKTPWMAIHPFTLEEEMQDPKIGSVYLAHKTGAKIIPTALELEGGSINLEGPLELAKGVAKRAEAIYHVGDIIDLPETDVSIIEEVLEKRKNREKISPEEREQFSQVHQELKKQADQVAKVIAEMLPEDQRGQYS